MAHLSLASARRLAEEMFPKGPEEVAEAMGVVVEHHRLKGTDGWCIQAKGHTPKIQINSNSAKTRQRFTLAHELSHLLLGTDPEIVSQSILPFQSVKKEERAADALASELLIPLVHLKSLVSEVPVDAKTIKDLAKKADVSHMVAAGRIVTEATTLGLINAAMAVFRNNEFQWHWSTTLTNVKAAAIDLLELAREALPAVYRSKPDSKGQVQTASLVGSPEYPVIVMQLLPSQKAASPTHHEKTRKLDEALFGDDHSFRQSFNGCLSSFKREAEQLELDDAVGAFNDHYDTWEKDRLRRLHSAAGQAYLRHRLSAWAVP